MTEKTEIFRGIEDELNSIESTSRRVKSENPNKYLQFANDDFLEVKESDGTTKKLNMAKDVHPLLLKYLGTDNTKVASKRVFLLAKNYAKAKAEAKKTTQ